MKLFDALFNWLQIRTVALGRPDDNAAHETERFFREILLEDHKVTNLDVDFANGKYEVRFTVEGEDRKHVFDQESVDKLLQDILAEPKYNEQ